MMGLATHGDVTFSFREALQATRSVEQGVDDLAKKFDALVASLYTPAEWEAIRPKGPYSYSSIGMYPEEGTSPIKDRLKELESTNARIQRTRTAEVRAKHDQYVADNAFRPEYV